ncbi:MAG: cell division FtsA domain-containing protein [Anaerolineae bacterium]
MLTEQERESGTVLIDIGGGTTDPAIFIDGTVWHSAVIAVGGDLITNDITHWMHVPFDVAEAVKIQYGNAREADVSPLETFLVQPFGEGMLTEKRRHQRAGGGHRSARHRAVRIRSRRNQTFRLRWSFACRSCPDRGVARCFRESAK